VLFGRNVASYKFALAKALLELRPQAGDLVRIEDLAEPYSRHICEHLKSADKQSTSGSSRFLQACRGFNQGAMEAPQLRETTVHLGFANVIDAFHVVNHAPVGCTFFLDERRGAGGIRITDNFSRLCCRWKQARCQARPTTQSKRRTQKEQRAGFRPRPLFQ
jgi:hypothetical protein